jgi:hypothetical protein
VKWAEAIKTKELSKQAGSALRVVEGRCCERPWEVLHEELNPAGSDEMKPMARFSDIRERNLVLIKDFR